MSNQSLDLTLEERAKFEALLTEHANASIDLVRATTRRHDALHAVNKYVNDRTGRIATSAYHEGIASVVVPEVPAPIAVPKGTTPEPPSHQRIAFSEAILKRWPDVRHDKSVTPVADCLCSTCCEARALAGVGRQFVESKIGGTVEMPRLLPEALRDEELPHPHGPLDPAQR